VSQNNPAHTKKIDIEIKEYSFIFPYETYKGIFVSNQE
jgi:hypothetical protein